VPAGGRLPQASPSSCPDHRGLRPLIAGLPALALLAVAVNTAIGVTQETHADRAVAALHRLGAATCRVVRDGADTVIPAAEAVRGDLVRLSAGDVVPADLTVIEAHRLRVDESAVTGESVAVGREPGEELAAGTVVAAGRALGEVVRTRCRQRRSSCCASC
jgi:Ca2+-transporting ATPase